MRKYNTSCVFQQRSSLVLLVALTLCLLFAMSCRLSKEKEPFECSLVDLVENPGSGYYDAVVKIERLVPDNALKTEFTVFTPTSSYEITDLSFVEDGQDPDRMETGDVFTVPMHKPDWKFNIIGKNDISCSLNFWEMLSVDEQWHPTKSEAMEIAQSIEIEFVEGLPMPGVRTLPEEWQLVGEKPPDQDDACGYVVYQKLRADEVKEEVNIQYCFLTEPEIKALSSGPVADFLFDWSDWTKEYGRSGAVAGYDAVYWDMQDMGEFDWAYRYAYIDSEMVIEIDINADPLEWVKTEQEKIQEGKAGKVLLRYGYGPVGEPEWQILIEIMMNGEGTFHKRSREGITIQKDFSLKDRELEEIQISLSENRFMELRSQSGLPGGITSFLSVRYGDQYHTVELKNVTVALYQNIEQTIKGIVLPKVDE